MEKKEKGKRTRQKKISFNNDCRLNMMPGTTRITNNGWCYRESVCYRRVGVVVVNEKYQEIFV